MIFYKYHALGNDYIVINPGDIQNKLTSSQIQRYIRSKSIEAKQIAPSEKGNRLVIGTMMWKRPNTFRFWAKHLQSLKSNFEIVLLAVGSEGETSRKLAQDCGVHYVEYPNNLGAKANARCRACQLLNPDYIMFLGSDNIVCNELLEYYWLNRHNDIIEVKDIYYFDTRSNTSVYCEGYTNHRKGEPLAPARMISRKVAELLHWSLWNDRKRAGIDSSATVKLNRFKRHQITIKDRFLVLDIKSNQNISKFDVSRDNWHIIDEEFIRERTNFNVLRRLQE